MIARLLGVLIGIILLVGVTLPAHTQEPTKPKFNVKIQAEKTVVAEVQDTGVIDPVTRINFSSQGNFFANIRTLQGQTLHLSHFPQFLINGRSLQPGQIGRIESANVPLPKSVNGKQRVGFVTVAVIDGLRITQTMELHPSKAKGPGQKRLLNNVLTSYVIENKTMQDVKLGVKVYMDTYVIDNDGCMYASPVTHPGKILDGMILQEKSLPPYLQMLQRPDLKNPGFVAHLSLNVGGKLERANKLVLTRHGAGGFGNWDMPAMASMGDSAVGLYWPTKDLKPGGKREVGYAYGEGIAVAPENDGQFSMSLGGSFDPGKAFTISAVVADPGTGQTLSLDLPAGMQRIEGKEVQPIAPLADDQEYSTVLWRVRVLQPGTHSIRIRSSTGVTQTKIVTITPATK